MPEAGHKCPGFRPWPLLGLELARGLHQRGLLESLHTTYPAFAERRQDMSRAARESVQGGYCWDDYVDRLVIAYEGLLD